MHASSSTQETFTVVSYPSGNPTTSEETQHPDFDAALAAFAMQQETVSIGKDVVLMYDHPELRGRWADSPEFEHLFSDTRH